MSWPTAPCAPGRDDELVGGRAVRGEGLRHRRLDALDRERLAVEHEQAVAVGVGAPEQVADRVHRRPRRRAARAACRRARPRSSRGGGRRRDPASTVSSTPSARSRSASQSGNVSGTTALVTPSAATARDGDLGADLGVGRARTRSARRCRTPRPGAARRARAPRAAATSIALIWMCLTPPRSA